MSMTYDEQYYRESVTVAPKTPPKHEYRTEDVTVTMEVFPELTGPLPLLIFDRPGARIAIEITQQSGDFLLNAVSDALNCLEDHHEARS